MQDISLYNSFFSHFSLAKETYTLNKKLYYTACIGHIYCFTWNIWYIQGLVAYTQIFIVPDLKLHFLNFLIVKIAKFDIKNTINFVLFFNKFFHLYNIQYLYIHLYLCKIMYIDISFLPIFCFSTKDRYI